MKTITQFGFQVTIKKYIKHSNIFMNKPTETTFFSKEICFYIIKDNIITLFLATENANEPLLKYLVYANNKKRKRRRSSNSKDRNIYIIDYKTLI